MPFIDLAAHPSIVDRVISHLPDTASANVFRATSKALRAKVDAVFPTNAPHRDHSSCAPHGPRSPDGPSVHPFIAVSQVGLGFPTMTLNTANADTWRSTSRTPSALWCKRWEILSPEPTPLSFPRSLYNDERRQRWPTSEGPVDYSSRGAWSARLASRAWVEARNCGDDAALTDTALFVGAVLDSALERLHTVVRPAAAAMEWGLYFRDWLDYTNDAISAALEAAEAALPSGVSAPEFSSRLRGFVRAIINWHWRPYTDSDDGPPPNLQGVFLAIPDFSVLGRFDVANTDADLHAFAYGLYRAAVDRHWEQASAEYKALFEPEPSSSGSDVTDEYEDEYEDEDEDELELWREVRPPTLTMEQMQYLLYRESQGDPTLRNYLAG